MRLFDARGRGARALRVLYGAARARSRCVLTEMSPQLLSLEDGVGDLRQRSALLTKARGAPRGRVAGVPGAGALRRALTASLHC